jgi:hypothetical protein
VSEDKKMSKAMRQMPGQPGRASVARGEAASDLASGEACGPPLEHPRTGSAKQLAGTGGLLEAALTRQNLQALLQVLQPLIDPTFSDHSHGFRPGRRAHDAVKAARAYVQSGKRVVVDVDLAKFFDQVNHDILIDRLKRRIDDAGVIRLVTGRGFARGAG